FHDGLETPPPLREDPGESPRESDVARPTSALPADGVDAANELGVDPEAAARAKDLGVDTEAAAEREATAVYPAERDRPLGGGTCERPRRCDGVARHAECARHDARRAAGDEPDRHVAVEAVDDLVVAAVSGEDVDPLGLPATGGPGDSGGVERPVAQDRLNFAPGAEGLLDRERDVGRDARGVGIDDQNGAHAP